jgi:hypothetical protein
MNLAIYYTNNDFNVYTAVAQLQTTSESALCCQPCTKIGQELATQNLRHQKDQSDPYKNEKQYVVASISMQDIWKVRTCMLLSKHNCNLLKSLLRHAKLLAVKTSIRNVLKVLWSRMQLSTVSQLLVSCSV